MVDRTSYDAFGENRNNFWWLNPLDGLSMQTDKGFTGHQRLENSGLIHMKGRVYDPSIGRFLSADPLIQNSFNSQSYNRYSYVWNNPLSMIDPTGFTAIDPELICAGKYTNKGTKRPGICRIANPVDVDEHYVKTGKCDSACKLARSREQWAKHDTVRENFHKEYGDILIAGNIDIDANIREAIRMRITPLKWKSTVASEGKWDYKVNEKLRTAGISAKRRDQFGNVHFGIVASAFGFDLATTLVGAGSYQVFHQEGGSIIGLLGAPYLAGNQQAKEYTEVGGTWGDNPGDSLQIMKGWEFHDSNY